MNLTKLAGYILLLMAAGYLVISLADFGPDYAAAGTIGDKAKDWGLQTTATNLRFHIGLGLLADVLIVGVIAIAGWWLTTTEVIQTIWIVLIGLFAIFSLVVRTTPVLPLSVAKVSAGGAFWGAQVQVPIYDDLTMRYPGKYVLITRKQTLRTAQAATAQGQAADMVALDFPLRSATDQYNSCSLPLTVMGVVHGTASVATENKVWTVPLIVVKSAQSGLPQKKG